MNPSRLHVFIVIVLGYWLTVNVHLNAQSIRTEELRSKFQAHRIGNLPEKVFLHLDRTGYVTGETMWFKGYVVDASSHQPTHLSKVLYIEILSANNSAVLQTSIALEDGLGSGSLFIPATIDNGNYTVRAYTKWMRNFPSEYYFEQAITIINPFKSPERVASKASKKLDAQFLPEGGNLVDGLTSRVAFRITNDLGKGIDCSGTVLNQNNETITTFTTTRFGLGSFEITPRGGQQYRIVLKDRYGEESIHSFPQVQPSGYAMNLSEENQSVNINIRSRSISSPLVYVFIHGRQQIISVSHGFLNEGSYTVTIPKADFVEGINHITIFNDQLQPVVERLYFKRPTDIFDLNIRTDQTSYTNREKVKVSIRLDQAPNININASVSVYRRDSITFSRHQQIQSYLTLTSDLHGAIESAEWYFDQDTDEAFDLLMLTHGWRRFSWKNILQADTVKKILPEIQAPILSGKLFDETGKPASNVETYFASPSYPIQLYTAMSKRDGEINYILKDFVGPHKAVLQTNLNRDSLYEFRMENNFSTSPSSGKLEKLDLNPAHQNEIIERSLSMQVQDIYYRDSSSTESRKDSTAFYGRADETYYLDDFTRFTVMEEVMREYVPGVWVRKRKGDFYFIVLDVVNKSVFRDDALVLIDGVPMFNLNQLMRFDPLKVRKLEVITRLFFLGRTSFNGIVSYSTYSGDLAGYALHPKSQVIDVEGVQIRREFYEPRYEQAVQRSREPDQRHLLLWNPDLKIEGGKAELDFFTSDLNGSFEIHVEGLSSQGQSISGRASFIVRPTGE